MNPIDCSNSTAVLETSEADIACVVGFLAFFCATGAFTIWVFVEDHRRHKRLREEAHKTTSHSESPKTPEWLKEAKETEIIKITQISNRLKFYTKPYTKEYQKDEAVDEFAIDHLQLVLNDIYAQTEKRKFAKLRTDTCLIQIAKPGFECGQKPEEFIPINLKGENDYFTYQMFGRVIQATLLQLEGRTIVAGITIYIKSPYADPLYFAKAVISHLLINEPILFPNQEHPEIPSFTDREAIVKSMVLHFCKFLKEPVQLYKMDGATVHMEWDREHETFMYVGCEECHEDLEHQDEPPSYQNATHQLLHEY